MSERYGENPTETAEKQPGLTVHIVRHGPAAYGELESVVDGYGPEFTNDPSIAFDLSMHGRGKSEGRNDAEIQEGIKQAEEKVRLTAEEIADTIEPGEEVVIWSSPTSRTLHTAKILRDTFRERGLLLRERGEHREEQIQVFDQFSDIKRFNYDHFVALADGGTITVDGKDIAIDKRVTNPKNLGYTEYYTSGTIHNIPEAIMEDWPDSLKESIMNMERFEEISERILSTLRRVSKMSDKEYRLIIVSHGSAADQIVRTYKPTALEGINPAEFVTVERDGDKLVVTHAGGFDGESDRDIFSTWDGRNRDRTE